MKDEDHDLELAYDRGREIAHKATFHYFDEV